MTIDRSRAALLLAPLALLPAACSAVLGIEDITVEGTGGASASSSSAQSGASSSGASTSSSSTSSASSSSSSSSTSSTGAGGCMGAPSTASAVDQDVHVRSGNGKMIQTKSIPIDLSMNHAIQAFAPKCGASGYDVIQGSGTTGGAITIPNVPAGPYWLNIDNVYVWITDRATTPDLGDYVAGRWAPAPSLAKAYTPVTMSFTNLDVWNDADEVDAYSLDGNGAYNWWNTGDLGATPGVTTSAMFDIDWRGTAPSALLQPGDVLWLGQLTAQSASGLPYLALTKYARLANLTIQDGQMPGMQIAAAFVAPDAATEQTTTPLALQVTAFEKQLAAVHPNAVADGTTLAIDPIPGPLSFGMNMLVDDVLRIAAPPASDLTTSVTYGDPFRSWGYAEVAVATFSAHKDYAVPNATPFSFPAALQRFDLPSAFAGAPAALQLSPPDAPTIDGAPFAKDGTLASDTPTIAWSAPKIRTNDPIAYVVQLVNLYANGSGKTVFQKGPVTLFTDATEVTLPQGLLKHGEFYVIAIYASQSSGIAFSSFPRRFPLPGSASMVLSGLLAGK